MIGGYLSRHEFVIAEKPGYPIHMSTGKEWEIVKTTVTRNIDTEDDYVVFTHHVAAVRRSSKCSRCGQEFPDDKMHPGFPEPHPCYLSKAGG